ncbi:MAG: DNA replication and repair protein RecF, partial [Bdellovibrionaceae bacterium]|nr:DNA replication and repair protein RecF [Pseudobdellovibrionaceae bacterium]
FDSLQTEFSPQLNFFLGPNGQGKTNLLEALYLLIKGHSFRYTQNDSFINHNPQKKEMLEPFNSAVVDNLVGYTDKSQDSLFKSSNFGHFLSKALIKADFCENDLFYKIQLIVENKSKMFSVNQKKVSSNQIQKKFQAILFSPESLSFIKESAEFRRELIDDFLGSIHPKNIDIISDYKKVLKTRNKILKENKDGKIESKSFFMVFDSLNELFIKRASILTYERIKAIKEIHNELNDHMQYISNNGVDIIVDYIASDESFLNFSLEDIELKLRERHKTLASAEISTGTSLIGPHKHDIVFLYNQKDSRFFCSQGQQRAIILSFKMAQIVYHRKTHGWYPVLMLDDVLSELDNEKKKRLISFLEKINTQIFITATELDDGLNFVFDRETGLGSRNHKIINISQGKILD